MRRPTLKPNTLPIIKNSFCSNKSCDGVSSWKHPEPSYYYTAIRGMDHTQTTSIPYKPNTMNPDCHSSPLGLPPRSIQAPAPAPVSPDSVAKLVRWGNGASPPDSPNLLGHEQTTSPDCRSTRSTRSIQLRRIQKAAKIELEYLKEVEKVHDKLESFQEALKKVQHQHHIEKIEQKIHKARKMEHLYLQKAKEIRGRRYRWTKLYELKFNKLQANSNQVIQRPKLPPLMSSRKRL